MIDYYPDIKLLHVTSVMASGTLFFLRGLAVQFGAAIAMAVPVRYLSYAIDTVLLCAALLLVWTLRDVVTGSSWLWVKIMLLPAYVVLGSFALKRAGTRLSKLGFFLAALTVFLFMYGIARSHDPLAGLGIYLPG